MRPLELSGQKFGRLTAIDVSHTSKLYGRVWNCECECGKSVKVVAKRLKSGMTKSCGCINRERAISMNEARKTHGQTKTRLFKSWTNMIQRCTNPNHKSYSRYGGRGVKVCSRWLNSFEAFAEDMGDRPFPEAQLDRIDNDGDYEASNCQWTSPENNANNRSNNRNVTHNGVTMSIARWARETCLSKALIRSRLEAGWSVEDALYTPVKSQKGKQK